MFGDLTGFRGHTCTSGCPYKSQLSLKYKYNHILKFLCDVFLILTDLIQMLISIKAQLCLHCWLILQWQLIMLSQLCSPWFQQLVFDGCHAHLCDNYSMCVSGVCVPVFSGKQSGPWIHLNTKVTLLQGLRTFSNL